ncbi:MAG: hypothetical protein OXR66_00555 [Candidatus Woesearchaeota archaeon]|nr:hypothetical protein [Candidatus Woesearchaeota archaeon]
MNEIERMVIIAHSLPSRGIASTFTQHREKNAILSICYDTHNPYLLYDGLREQDPAERTSTDPQLLGLTTGEHKMTPGLYVWDSQAHPSPHIDLSFTATGGLRTRRSESEHPLIDHVMTSAAAVYGERTIGIFLGGFSITPRQGQEGARAVRDAGGKVYITCKYKGNDLADEAAKVCQSEDSQIIMARLINLFS